VEPNNVNAKLTTNTKYKTQLISPKYKGNEGKPIFQLSPKATPSKKKDQKLDSI